MKKVIGFLLSERGDTVEWLVRLIIIGLGCIPIILGISRAISLKMQEQEDAISDITSSGY